MDQQDRNPTIFDSVYARLPRWAQIILSVIRVVFLALVAAPPALVLLDFSFGQGHLNNWIQKIVDLQRVTIEEFWSILLPGIKNYPLFFSSMTMTAFLISPFIFLKIRSHITKAPIYTAHNKDDYSLTILFISINGLCAMLILHLLHLTSFIIPFFISVIVWAFYILALILLVGGAIWYFRKNPAIYIVGILLTFIVNSCNNLIFPNKRDFEKKSYDMFLEFRMDLLPEAICASIICLALYINIKYRVYSPMYIILSLTGFMLFGTG